MAIHLLGKKLSSFQIIIIGFLGAILMGAFLLMLPVSSRDGMSASFETALFTSTSAVCVTGLVVRDTATCWSRFGQAVILAVRAGRHTGPHTDRRSWNRHIRRVYSPDFRKKDFTA